MSDIEIRLLSDLQEIKELEELQLTIWGRDLGEMIPAHLMHALQFSGASVIGAYDGRQIIGFAFAALGTVEGLTERIDQVAAARLKMYSVIAGILPGYRDANVGYRLKQAQRDFALRIGIRLITWTVDPLESRNARFNIGKLGAVCHRYMRNFHGEMTGINAGMASDRFEIEWWITSNRVKIRAKKLRGPLSYAAIVGGGAVLINEAAFNVGDLPVPPLNYTSPMNNLLLVEIPDNIQLIKERDMNLAIRWRDHSRYLFEELFDKGYLITDFVRKKDLPDRYRSFYLLSAQDA